MKKNIIIFFMVQCLAFYAYSVLAGGIAVSLQLDRDTATPGDTITLTVRVSGSRDADSLPEIRGLEPFEVTSTGTAGRVEIVNGKISSGIDYTYLLRPLKTGTFRIGPARVRVKGKMVSTDSVTLVVTRAPVTDGADRGDVFLDAALSPPRVYTDETAIYTLKLYHRVRVGNLSLDLPEVAHVTFRQLEKPRQYTAMYNGNSYRVVEIRYAVAASVPGTYEIRPARMEMTAYRPRSRSRRGPFGDPFFDGPFFSGSAGEPLQEDSPPVELEVQPLPDKGCPVDFSGLVGTFRMTAALTPTRMKAGDSATLTVTVKGRGNVRRIPDLKGPSLDGVKVYPDQPVLKEETGPRGISGSKTLKWALVPEREGQFDIPPFALSYFDTGRGAYTTLRTSILSLRVFPGGHQTAMSGSFPVTEKKPGPGAVVTQRAVKEIGHDILPIHTAIRDASVRPYAHPGGGVFWLLLMGPFMACCAGYGGRLLRQKAGRNDGAAVRARKAARNVFRRYRKDLPARLLMSMTLDYFNDRFGRSLGTLTPGEAEQILAAEGVSPGTAEEMKSLLQLLEDAVYTGKADRPCAGCPDLSRLIRRIEKEIR